MAVGAEAVEVPVLVVVGLVLTPVPVGLVTIPVPVGPTIPVPEGWTVWLPCPYPPGAP